MGRLVNPGPGEQFDRLSVLGLKLLFGTEAGKDTSHFERERAVLLTQVRASNRGDWGVVLELAAVNAALWHAENQLRDLREGYDPKTGAVPGQEMTLLQAGHVAFRIQSLNDRRAELIGQLNAEAGETAKEKI